MERGARKGQMKNEDYGGKRKAKRERKVLQIKLDPMLSFLSWFSDPLLVFKCFVRTNITVLVGMAFCLLVI